MVGMYWQQLSAFADATTAAGGTLYGPGSPASTLCSFPLPTQSLGHLFLIEWFVDAYIVSIISVLTSLCYSMLTWTAGYSHLGLLGSRESICEPVDGSLCHWFGLRCQRKIITPTRLLS